MTTDANYVGRANNAKPNEQTVNSGHSIPPALDSRQVDSTELRANLQTVQKDLIEQISNYAESTSYVPILNELIQVWLLSPGLDLAHKSNKILLRRALDLASILIELKETCQTYEYFLDKIETGEVSHD